MQSKNLLIGLQAKTVELLNKQISMEHQASAQYLTMASWCDVQGYVGSANFFYAQADEERQHMLKIFKFVTEADCFTTHPTLQMDLARDFDSLHSIFKLVMKYEQAVTATIHDLVQHCLAAKDFSTYNFLQWFVSEQIEEESMVKKILDLFEIIKDENGLGLHTIDQNIGNLVN